PFQESTLRFGDVCVSVCVFVCVFVCVCVCVCVRECVVRLAVFAVSLLQPKGQHHTLSLSACRLCRTNPVRLLSLLPSLSYPAHTLSSFTETFTHTHARTHARTHAQTHLFLL